MKAFIMLLLRAAALFFSLIFSMHIKVKFLAKMVEQSLGLVLE